MTLSDSATVIPDLPIILSIITFALFAIMRIAISDLTISSVKRVTCFPALQYSASGYKNKLDFPTPGLAARRTSCFLTKPLSFSSMLLMPNFIPVFAVFFEERVIDFINSVDREKSAYYLGKLQDKIAKAELQTGQDIAEALNRLCVAVYKMHPTQSSGYAGEHIYNDIQEEKRKCKDRNEVWH